MLLIWLIGSLKIYESRGHNITTHMVTGSIVKPHFSLAGCTMLPVTTHTVAYPAGVLTNEQYSAPVVPNSELYVSTSVCMSVFENNGLLLQ